MKCPLCSTENAACGHSFVGTPVHIPRSPKMAEKGPLVRVNTEKDTIMKMTQKRAKEFVATHPGAKILPPRVASEPEYPFAERDEVDAQSVPVKPPVPATPKSTASKS